MKLADIYWQVIKINFQQLLINMPSRDRKRKELKRIADSGNQRKLSFKKQRDEVRGRGNPDFY